MKGRFSGRWLSRLVRRRLGTRLATVMRRMIYRTYSYLENYNHDIFTNGEYDLMRKLATLDISTVFDVGANVGDWSLIAADLFSRAKIYCFEIAEPTLEELKSRCRSRQNILINEFGLSDLDGTVQIRYYPEATGLTTIYPFPHPQSFRLSKGIVRQGDTYLEEHGIEHIDFMKIDVEGSDLVVLRGFARSLQQRRIDMLQFEYGYMNIVNKTLLYDFYDLLNRDGYAVGKVYPGCVQFCAYDFARENFIGSNYLAVREDRSDLIALVSR